MQSKRTMSYFNRRGWLVSKKTETRKCWFEWREMWTLVWGFLRKLKIELAYDLEVPLLGIQRKQKQNTNLKNLHALQCSQQPRYRRNLGVHQHWWMGKNDVGGVCVHVQWNITTLPLKRVKFIHFQQHG